MFDVLKDGAKEMRDEFYLAVQDRMTEFWEKVGEEFEKIIS